MFEIIFTFFCSLALHFKKSLSKKVKYNSTDGKLTQTTSTTSVDAPVHYLQVDMCVTWMDGQV